MSIRRIDPRELGHFGLDENNRLYWDGIAVQTESVVSLNAKQAPWGIAIAIATVLSALATMAYTAAYVYTLHQSTPAQIKQPVSPATKDNAPAVPFAVPTATLPPCSHKTTPAAPIPPAKSLRQ